MFIWSNILKPYLVVLIVLFLSSCFTYYKEDISTVSNSYINSDKDAYTFEVKKGQTLVFIDSSGNQQVIKK
jgi:hypothetical protein